ncbi:MAG: sugar O-acetyltransferase [Lachnospiraceae bacterium]|nr:sugar O-acetyltransferase [Lachnospiraceae bacterium]
MTTEQFLEIMKQDKGYIAKHDECMDISQIKAKKLIYQYNNTAPDEMDKRQGILRELFENPHSNVLIEPPFHCDYGFNIHFEGFAFMNYNCTILDTSPVYIGENVFIAPGVCIACAGHGVHPSERKIYQTSKPIHIGKNVWIGAGVVILPGVHIGDGSIIGAGSVVNKDIPQGVIAAGNPCKVIRNITDDDIVDMEQEIRQI